MSAPIPTQTKLRIRRNKITASTLSKATCTCEPSSTSAPSSTPSCPGTIAPTLDASTLVTPNESANTTAVGAPGAPGDEDVAPTRAKAIPSSTTIHALPKRCSAQDAANPCGDTSASALTNPGAPFPCTASKSPTATVAASSTVTTLDRGRTVKRAVCSGSTSRSPTIHAAPQPRKAKTAQTCTALSTASNVSKRLRSPGRAWAILTGSPRTPAPSQLPAFATICNLHREEKLARSSFGRSAPQASVWRTMPPAGATSTSGRSGNAAPSATLSLATSAAR